jgi:hypothetical protein
MKARKKILLVSLFLLLVATSSLLILNSIDSNDTEDKMAVHRETFVTDPAGGKCVTFVMSNGNAYAVYIVSYSIAKGGSDVPGTFATPGNILHAGESSLLTEPLPNDPETCRFEVFYIRYGTTARLAHFARDHGLRRLLPRRLMEFPIHSTNCALNSR